MKLAAAVVPILIWVLARPAGAEVPGTGIAGRSPQDRWKIDFKAGLAEQKGKSVFSVDGFTNLPAETVLRARVYILDLVNDVAGGLREDDGEPLLREDDPFQPASPRFTAAGGWFHQDVHAFVRKPYSIRYRVKIHYHPEDQTEPVRLKVGDEPFFRKSDLRAGTEADYAVELRERLAEVTRDLAALEKLGLEFRGLAFQRPWNGDAWSRWKAPAGATLDGIRDGNRHRFAIWAVYIEGQARMRVGALCDFLQHCIDRVDDGAAFRDEERVRSLLRGYRDSVEEAIDVIGADVPVQPLQAGAALQAYERAIAPLRQPGVTRTEVRKAHAEALAALFDLGSMLRIRRRGYVHLNAVSVTLARVYENVDAKAPAGDLRQALREHDSALLDFKAFVRLP